MIKGKQIVDHTIQQQKLNLVDPILEDDAATKNYVDRYQSVERMSVSNEQMLTETTTSDGDLATSTAIIDEPVMYTAIKVFVNGNNVPVGDSDVDFCYFSNDGGTSKRPTGLERSGDLLYWVPSVAFYNLEAGEKIDFRFLTSNTDTSAQIVLEAGDTYTVSDTVDRAKVKYDGAADTSATLILNTESFLVGDVAGAFVFDIGGGQEHTFATIGETIEIDADGHPYDITYDGVGSLLFSFIDGYLRPAAGTYDIDFTFVSEGISADQQCVNMNFGNDSGVVIYSTYVDNPQTTGTQYQQRSFAIDVSGVVLRTSGPVGDAGSDKSLLTYWAVIAPFGKPEETMVFQLNGANAIDVASPTEIGSWTNTLQSPYLVINPANNIVPDIILQSWNFVFNGTPGYRATLDMDYATGGRWSELGYNVGP